MSTSEWESKVIEAAYRYHVAYSMSRRAGELEAYYDRWKTEQQARWAELVRVIEQLGECPK